MSTLNNCSFCQETLIKTNVTDLSQVQQVTKKVVVETLFQAANITIPPHQNCFVSCAKCNNILLQICTHYSQLQEQLIKIKSIILQNLHNTINYENQIANILVKDLNPSLILSRTSTTEYHNVLENGQNSFNIKEEIEYELESGDLDTDNYTNCAEIRPNGSSDKSYCNPPTPASDHSSVISSSSTCTFLPKSKSKPSPARFKRKKITKLKTTQKRKTSQIIPLGEEQDLRLTPLLNGSYDVGGITLTPVEATEGEQHSTNFVSKTQRNLQTFFKCGQCDKVVRGLYNLKAHIKETHFGIQRSLNNTAVTIRGKRIKLDPSSTTDGCMILHGVKIIKSKKKDAKNYTCGSCSASYKERSKIFIHIQHVHAKIPKEPKKTIYGPKTEAIANRGKSKRTEDGRWIFCGVEIIDLGTEDDNPHRFQCGSCNRSWKYKGNVMAHIKKHHPDNTPYSCTVSQCGAAFAYKHLLEKHQVKHANDKPYICDRCGISCKRKVSLEEHIQRIHLNVIHFTCQHCQKGFFGKKDFRLHMLRHG